MKTITKDQIDRAIALTKDVFGPLSTGVRYELQDAGESVLLMVDLERMISAEEEERLRERMRPILQIVPFNTKTLSPMVVGLFRGSDLYSFT